LPLFFFQLRGGDRDVLDEQGVLVPEEKLAERALRDVRRMIAMDALEGSIDLRPRLDVEDASGLLVLSQPFADAVRLVPVRPASRTP